MKVFYVFKINENFSYMYRGKSYRIYNILQELRYVNDYNTNDVKRSLDELVCKLNIDSIDKFLIDSLYYYKDYYNKNHVHIICNNDEYTKLVVEDYLVKVKTNQKYPAILNYINGDNYFACDFVNKDFFWLNVSKKSCLT